MKIAAVSAKTNFGARDALKNTIYIKPVKSSKTQEGIIKAALDELRKVDFDKNDIAYMRSMGINPPFKNGREAVEHLEKNHVPIQYGKFSDKRVHACLGRGDNNEKAVMINARYKDSTEPAVILATAQAIAHEAGHDKDNDNSNTIQEELDNLSLNVLAYRGFDRMYPGVFDGQESFFFKEGVSLYPRLFFEFGADKTGLKARVADKYGHLPEGDSKHPASKMAKEIKEIDLIA